MEWSRGVEWSLEWSGVELEFGVESPLKQKKCTILYGTCEMKRKRYYNHFCILDVNNLVH